VTYVIAVSCVDLKDKACVEECPVDCIYEGRHEEVERLVLTASGGPFRGSVALISPR
jgi:1-deoxy-D-xylulose 5-phosphate reductoisomerase